MKPHLLFAGFSLTVSAAVAQINTVQSVAPGVYFHEGDPRRGHIKLNPLQPPGLIG